MVVGFSRKYRLWNMLVCRINSILIVIHIKKKKITSTLSFILTHLPAASWQFDTTQHWEEKINQHLERFPARQRHFLSECSYNCSSYGATAAPFHSAVHTGDTIFDDIIGRLKTSYSDDPSTFLKSFQLEDFQLKSAGRGTCWKRWRTQRRRSAEFCSVCISILFFFIHWGKQRKRQCYTEEVWGGHRPVFWSEPCVKQPTEASD